MIFSPIQGRMQKISQIVRLVFEIFLTEAHYICVLKVSVRAPTPTSKYKLGDTPNQLERMTVWHIVLGDIFDERRAAPPAYGRRAWSKVGSYLLVFRYVFRYWSDFRRRLQNKTVQKYKKLVKTMLWQLGNNFFGFEVSSVSTLCVVRKLFFGQIVSDGPKGQLKQSNMHVEIKRQ